MTPPVNNPAFDLGRYQDPLAIQRVLYTAKTVAIVGLSRNELRASYFVGYYLRRHGYTVIPVNPREPEIPELWQVVVTCRSEDEQHDLFDRLTDRGYDCRVLVM